MVRWAIKIISLTIIIIHTSTDSTKFKTSSKIVRLKKKWNSAKFIDNLGRYEKTQIYGLKKMVLFIPRTICQILWNIELDIMLELSFFNTRYWKFAPNFLRGSTFKTRGVSSRRKIFWWCWIWRLYWECYTFEMV